MSNKEELIDKLSLERQELCRGALGKVDSYMIDALDCQIRELIGNDSFRSHELQDNVLFVDKTLGKISLSEELSEYGYMSESFHDPNLDY